MTEYFLVISLTDDGGKWAPGTIIFALPASHKFNGGDMACFHIERISTSKYSLAELQAMCEKKTLNLRDLIPTKTLDAKLAQKANVHFFLADARFVGLPGKMVVASIGEITEKPDLENTTDFDSLTLSDCAKEFKPKLIEVVPEEALEQLDAQRLGLK